MTEPQAARQVGSRRDELIAAAADLLREGGPDALTTVAVAARCGITQPAVYRHVDNIDELSGLASGVIVGELHDVISSMISAPDVDFHDLDDVTRLMNGIVEAMDTHARAFAVVDRWRSADGVLGDGIRAVMAEGRAVIEFALELRWRHEYGVTAEIDDDARRAQAVHARLMHDDAHAIARLVRDPLHGLSQGDAVRLLTTRLDATWAAYAVDMSRRTGHPTSADGTRVAT